MNEQTKLSKQSDEVWVQVWMPEDNNKQVKQNIDQPRIK